MVIKRRPVLYLLLLAVIAMLGAVVWWRVAASNRAVTVPADLAITRASTGGLAGGGDGGSFSLNHSQLIAKTKQQTLTHTQLQEIVRKINRSNFFELGPFPSTPTCSDGFSTSLSITMNGQSRSAQFYECDPDDLPRGLVELNNHLRDLARAQESVGNESQLIKIKHFNKAKDGSAICTAITPECGYCPGKITDGACYVDQKAFDEYKKLYPNLEAD